MTDHQTAHEKAMNLDNAYAMGYNFVINHPQYAEYPSRILQDLSCVYVEIWEESDKENTYALGKAKALSVLAGRVAA